MPWQVEVSNVLLGGVHGFPFFRGGRMKDTNGQKDWLVLCELASKEKDPKKLLDLITKINQALEEYHHKPRAPLSENAHFYNVAPVIVEPVPYDC